MVDRVPVDDRIDRIEEGRWAKAIRELIEDPHKVTEVPLKGVSVWNAQARAHRVAARHGIKIRTRKQGDILFLWREDTK